MDVFGGKHVVLNTTIGGFSVYLIEGAEGDNIPIYPESGNYEESSILSSIRVNDQQYSYVNDFYIIGKSGRRYLVRKESNVFVIYCGPDTTEHQIIAINAHPEYLSEVIIIRSTNTSKYRIGTSTVYASNAERYGWYSIEQSIPQSNKFGYIVVTWEKDSGIEYVSISGFTEYSDYIKDMVEGAIIGPTTKTQTIPVNWPRYNDGKILTASFDITVSPKSNTSGGTTGGTTVDDDGFSGNEGTF